MIPSMVVWAEPIKSGDFELAPHDIPAAIEWFREKTKQEPRLIILNPKNEHLAKEAGDSIRVMYLDRVLTWEIWLSPESHFKGGSTSTGLPARETKMSISNEPSVTMDIFRPRGRPKHYEKRELPEELIRQLSSEGMGSRAIASTLKKRDIIVSYKTIQRVLSGER
jgi:hypothetical protein